MIQITNAVERYGKLILNELKEANINCWLAGGALRDYFAGVKVNTDYDLFFPNARDIYPVEEFELPEGLDTKLTVTFGDEYEYVIFQ